MSDIHSEVVIMMDTLDLDEEVVDRRLDLLMSKTEYTEDNFKTMLVLLKYKYSINVKEDDDCENNKEISYIPKLISSVNERNVNYVAKIVSTSLLLNKESLLFNAEHLLQQIMPEFALSYPHVAHTISQNDLVRIVNLLKITDAVFDAVMSINSKVPSIYNETPLEHLLYSQYKPLTIQLLNHTIPKMFKSLQDYNILDRIWEFVERRNASHNNIDYEIITGLSDFYLPVNIGLADIYESTVVTKPTFWHLIFKGLYSSDSSLRKYSLFFLKRMLDSVMSKKRNLKVDFEGDVIFTWTLGKSGEVQRCWNNYFILMESLQEKQSNIVVSAFPLLLQLLEVHERWIHSALFFALQHESSIVVKVAVEYSLKFPFTKTFPVEQFLLALNNNLFFEEVIEVEGQVSIRKMLVTSFSEDLQKLIQVVKYLNQIPWSPVSRFYMSCILCCITNCKKLTKQQTNGILMTATQVKGNNLLLKLASKCCYLQFMVNCGYAIELTILSSLLKDFSKSMLLIDSQPRRSLVKWIQKVYEHFPTNYQDLINQHDFQNTLRTQNVFYLFMMAFPDRENILKSFVMNSLQNVDNINARQYAAVNDCADDLLFITGLLNKLHPTVSNFKQSCNLSIIYNLICHNFNSILKYISKYLMGICDTMSFEVLRACTESFNSMASINPKCYCNDIIELNKLAILSLQTEHDNYAQKSFAARILAKLYSAQFNKTTNLNIYKLDTITCFRFLKEVGYENSKIVSHDKIQKGKLRSFYNESLCELFFVLLSNDIAKQSPSPKDILPVIDAVLEVGGHGCLMWILKIYAIIFHDLLLGDSHVVVIEFIEKCWKLTMELKSNEQFKPCLNAFIDIILSKQIVCTKKMHEIIHKYVEEILEFGLSSNASSRYLVDFVSQNLKDLNQPILFEVIGKLLLFGNVPRKDQRIEQKTCLSILADEQKYPIKEEYYTDASIRNMALKFLIESDSPEIYGAVSKILRQNIDSKFKSKKRYHANSLHHRLLTRSVQHLLSIFLIKPTCTEVKNAVYWCVDLLEKLPHQPSVKMYLEWFIAVYIIIQDIHLDTKVCKELENIPQTSRFLILYHVIKHKMKMRLCSSNDFSFVMDYLLSFTMAQIFNIRLHAQYLALALNNLHKTLNIEAERQYDQICSVIQKTFDVSSSEKSLIKMREDIYFNNFDVMFYFNPAMIYHHVPILHCAATDEIISQNELPTIDQYIKQIRQNYENANIENKSWNYLHKCLTSSDAVKSFSVNTNFSLENSRGDYDILIHDKEDVMTASSIQKKYVPWTRMLADMDISVITASLNKKPESASNLIVVATLIDRLPNLGGIARTCEVFGVSKYVVDYKRMLQDREFKSLSVSAERWLDIQEVRPGNLKKYINDMKNYGYSIVAAEQTSNSSSLESFKFPKLTVLILGHEKNGIPCDILPLMEHCVEIPQKGLIRSLNVHVAASIFIWEYTKQHS